MIERYSNAEMARVWSAENKAQKWLEIEIAACEAWAEQGVVPPEALPSIRKATFNLERMAEIEARTQHDVTAFISCVTEGLGEEGRFVHHGLTSSDIVDTGLALQVQEAAAILRKDVEALIAVLGKQAVKYRHTLAIGRTHGVHAEPTTFGLKLALWYDETRRNLERLDYARDQMAVGKVSGTVGTHATAPPAVEEYVCSKLGLRPAPVSSQIVQRDRHAHFITTLALIAGSLEKIATEIRGLQRTEILEVEEPFGEGQTGSSAMPHKRNPVLSERICGLARVIRGHAVTAMENVALWHERDISHSSAERILFPDACGLLDYILRLATFVLENLTVYPERMRRNLDRTRGLVFSQRVLLALIDKGLSRKEAYAIVQSKAMEAWGEEKDFIDLLREDGKVSELLSDKELKSLFDYEYYLKHIDVSFQRLGLGLAHHGDTETRRE
ncbi:MAG: adenylosuccinate lyase [Chloroflexi bacterium]|nr:adenylosuccinate lyase [Chloroflexota bacterium]MDA8188782.1 adenylosuccinate lyase [Dehalococcoidales bacterium]